MVLRSARPRIVLTIAAGVVLGVLAPGAVALGAAPSPAPAAPTDAGTALDNAIAGLQGIGYNITGTIGSTASGGTGTINAVASVDPATGAQAVFKGTESGIPVEIQFVQTPAALYAKINIPPIQQQLGVGPDQWMKVDESKITKKNNIPFDLSGGDDAINISGLMTSVSNVKYPNPSDTKTITGTVDLTQATGVGSPNPSDVQSAGPAAKATPFTATLDDQGRLAELKINADGFDGNLSQNIKFGDYGAPAPITVPPASAVVPAPAAAYQFFNS
jgi:hypothetical protein